MARPVSSADAKDIMKTHRELQNRMDHVLAFPEGVKKKLDGVVLLIDDEEQRVGDDVHLAVVVLHVVLLGLEHLSLDTLLAEELDERLVLGQTLVGAVEAQSAFFHLVLIVAGHHALGVGQERKK